MSGNYTTQSRVLCPLKSAQLKSVQFWLVVALTFKAFYTSVPYQMIEQIIAICLFIGFEVENIYSLHFYPVHTPRNSGHNFSFCTLTTTL